MAVRVLPPAPQLLLQGPHSPSTRLKPDGRLAWQGCSWQDLHQGTPGMLSWLVTTADVHSRYWLLLPAVPQWYALFAATEMRVNLAVTVLQRGSITYTQARCGRTVLDVYHCIPSLCRSQL